MTAAMPDDGEQRDGRQPFLSVVATARNDDHGGHLLHRLQIFATGLASQCDRHKIDAELILVEWNPPPERPSLVHAVEWPESNWLRSRVIVVPNDLHCRLAYSDRLPLFQMIAKNVGIRRARGEWILATNVDVLLSDTLCAFLAAGELDHRRYYRVDRSDIADALEPSMPIQEQLRLASENVIRIASWDATRDVRTGAVYRIYSSSTKRLAPVRAARLRRGLSGTVWRVGRPCSYALRWTAAWLVGRRRREQIQATIAFVTRRCSYALRWTAAWLVGRRRREQIQATIAFVTRRCSYAPRWTAAWLVGRRRREQIRSALPLVRSRWPDALRWTAAWIVDRSRREQILAFPACATRRCLYALRWMATWIVGRHPGGQALPALVGSAPRDPGPALDEEDGGVHEPSTHQRYRYQYLWEDARVHLHTNTCGDFTLLRRDAWYRLRGYPELEMFSMHLDSLLLYQAYYAGYREEILPFPLYHIEHESGFTPERSEELDVRLDKAALPQITMPQFHEWVAEMLVTSGPLEFNGASWGLAEIDLLEISPGPPPRDTSVLR